MVLSILLKRKLPSPVWENNVLNHNIKKGGLGRFWTDWLLENVYPLDYD